MIELKHSCPSHLKNTILHFIGRGLVNVSAANSILIANFRFYFLSPKIQVVLEKDSVKNYNTFETTECFINYFWCFPSLL